MREDRMTPEERRALGRRKNPMLHQLEEQLRGSLGLSAEAFHRVRFDRWEAIYEQIADRFADRTRSRRNGLHWANTNGYSPWAMARLAGCWHTDSQSWFLCLPQLLPGEGAVYLVLELGPDRFWLFEGEVGAMVSVLTLLSGTAFLGLGHLDYYLVSRKFRWIMGYNLHDMVSLAGEGFALENFSGFPPP